MAGYYKSKQKTGGIVNAIQPILDYFTQKKKEDEDRQSYENLLSLFNTYQQRQNSASQPPPNTNGQIEEPKKTTSQDRYNKAKNNQRYFEDALLKQTLDPKTSDKQLSRINVLNELAKRRTDEMNPNKNTSYFDLGAGQKRYRMNSETGKVEEVADNPKDFAERKPDKKDFKISEDGFYIFWDDAKNDWVKTSQKAPSKDTKGSSGESSGWARLFWEMNKDKDNKDQKKYDNQGKYNALMGSTFVDIEGLKKRGLLKDDDEEAKNFGGAYLVRDQQAYNGWKLIYSDTELEDYAKNQVPDTPNKWERTDPAGIKNKETDPLGIR